MRGEPYFRQQEIELTLELRQCGNMVVAPGGGWVTNKGVVEIVRPARAAHLSEGQARRRRSRDWGRSGRRDRCFRGRIRLASSSVCWRNARSSTHRPITS